MALDGPTLTLAGPGHLTLDRARALAAGWHFRKELLTANEHEMLSVVEALLAELDRIYGGNAPVLLTDPEVAQVSVRIQDLLGARTHLE